MKNELKYVISMIVSILFFIAVYTFIWDISGKITGNTENLGDVAKISMSNYVPIFILMGFLLLSSMIGAFYLASREGGT